MSTSSPEPLITQQPFAALEVALPHECQELPEPPLRRLFPRRPPGLDARGPVAAGALRPQAEALALRVHRPLLGGHRGRERQRGDCWERLGHGAQVLQGVGEEAEAAEATDVLLKGPNRELSRVKTIKNK